MGLNRSMQNGQASDTETMQPCLHRAYTHFHPCLYQDREEKKGTRNPRGNVHPESFNPNNPNSTKTVPLIHCPSVIERPKMALAVVYSSSSGSSLHSIHFGSEYAGNVANYRTSMTEIKKNGMKGLGTPWHFIKVHPYSSLWPPHSWALPWHPWLCGTSKDHQWTTSPEQLSQLANCQKLPTELEVPDVEATLKKVWEGALDHLPRAKRDSKNPT